LTEPGGVPKMKLNESVEVTLWDRWDIKNGKDLTVEKLFDYL